MHAIGNSADMVAVKNVVGSLRVAFRNAIDIAAEVERELRHVETILLAKQSEFLDLDVVFAQDALDQCIRKSVESRLDRRVGRENALLADTGVLVERLPEGYICRRSTELPQEIERKERGVAFVQMIRPDIEAKGLQYEGPANAEHDLLLEAMGIVSSVKVIRDFAVRRTVLIKIGIEEQDWDTVADERSLQRVEPRPDPDLSSLDPDRDDRAERL